MMNNNLGLTVTYPSALAFSCPPFSFPPASGLAVEQI